MKLNIVPASTGMTWVRLGIKTFMQQPLAMSGLFFLYLAAVTVLSLIPVVGLLLAFMVVPAAMLGLMAATQEAVKGKFPMPTVLLSAFRAGRERLGAMLVLGALYAAFCVLINWMVPMLVDPPVAADATREAMMTPQFQLAMLKNMSVSLLLYLPVLLLFWHAPALVHWHGVSPVKSLFFSVVACVRNAGAFLMFGFGWFVVSMALAIVLSVLAGLTGSADFMAAAMMPLALLIAAMFSTSIYFTFRDSFVATVPGDPPDGAESTENTHNDPATPGDAS
ncbi:MAG: BPSS1780 family membrane protein [Polaromonas sp.]|uniref:BPSS1780 family membrane protein n=1 Tax=Polaromonas sp. TaxID=1869339 RepID=UPI003263D2A3